MSLATRPTSLARQLLGSLLGAPTQDQRFIKLHTPLGPDLLVAERLQVDEAIGPVGPSCTQPADAWSSASAASLTPASAPASTSTSTSTSPSTCGMRIVVDALSLDAHLELKRLIGQPALVELLTQTSRTALRPWHGHIGQAALVGSDGGLARYRLVIEPWLAFLGQGQDSWVFQNQTVQAIVEEVFADYSARGPLAPAWRWDLADASLYPRRSLCIQYQESDLQFVQRLLREEGLFHWFEHSGDVESAALGSHTLVIADHNGAFRPDSHQPRVRYTQSHIALGEDSLTTWKRHAHVRTARLALASPDHRALSLRAVSEEGRAGARGQGQGQDQAQDGKADQEGGRAALPVASTLIADIPGAYAYEDLAQGERLALRQMQAVDALRDRVSAASNVRSTAPGRSFTLLDHPVHDGSIEARDCFVVLSARHTARSNLHADARADLPSLADALRRDKAAAEPASAAPSPLTSALRPDLASPNDTDEPLYTCELSAQLLALPVRISALDARGQPDPRIHTRPNVPGVQTALVVGLPGAPIHTDRDHRIKIQFHWQRGGNSSHRLDHPGGSGGGGGGSGNNAPASDASGTWVRVVESVAGANWGMNFTPRLGQEVLVGFIEGDIDRPVVIGSVYNGRGEANAQANQVAAGAAQATGNAPAWFPGDQTQSRLQGHQHPAVHAGFKSQALATSQSGSGGFNQLVHDDTPQAGRIELSTSAGAASGAAGASAGMSTTRLQLGHLLQQTGNQRLQARGHGLDLMSNAWGAVRAGGGLLLSAHAKPGSASSGQQLDSREPQASLEQAGQLVHALAESAQKQNAKVEGEPGVIGATDKDTSRQLSVERAHRASLRSWGASAQQGGGQGGGSSAAGAAGAAGSTAGATIGGGLGTVAAWSRPDLVLAAPGGIASFTPAASIYSAGNTLSLVASQDVQHLAQGNHATAVKSGLVLYTYGKVTAKPKPNQETGIRLHAASGSVSTQSQSGATRLTADKSVEVSSTGGMVRITAPNHVLLTAAGAALDIQAGSITLKGPGKIEFRASLKELTGGAAAHSLPLDLPNSSFDLQKPPLPFARHVLLIDNNSHVIASRAYRLWMTDGRIITGVSDPEGLSEEFESRGAEVARVDILKHGGVGT